MTRSASPSRTAQGVIPVGVIAHVYLVNRDQLYNPPLRPPAGAGTAHGWDSPSRMLMMGLKLRATPTNACALPMRPPFCRYFAGTSGCRPRQSCGSSQLTDAPAGPPHGGRTSPWLIERRRQPGSPRSRSVAGLPSRQGWGVGAVSTPMRIGLRMTGVHILAIRRTLKWTLGRDWSARPG